MMKVFVLVAVTCLSACTWFGSRKPPVPDPTEIIVTGAPAGSLVLIDGKPRGQPMATGDRARVLSVSPGPHTVEIRVGDPVVYREELDVSRGEHRVVTVLSGVVR